MSALTRRTAWALLILPLVLVAIGACNSGSSDTSTTTPAPIVADPDADLMAVFQSIPVDEQQCVVQTLGQTRLDEILAQADSSEDEDMLFGQCLSGETLARILVGGLISEIGNLSDSTMDCMWTALEEVDLEALVAENTDMSGVFGAMMKMTLCLSDEEVAQAEESGVISDFPVSEMRCMAERIDEDDLVSLFTFGAEGEAPPLDILNAMLECGLENAGPDDEDPPFTQEQLACLRDAVGDEALAQMFDQEGDLSFDLIFAVIECGLDLGSPDGEGPDFTQEQLTCLRDAVGDETLTQMFDQEGAPPLDVIFALLECGFAMPDESDGVDSTPDGAEEIIFTPEQLACIQDAVGDAALLEILNGERIPTFEEIMSMANCDLDFLGLTGGN